MNEVVIKEKIREARKRQLADKRFSMPGGRRKLNRRTKHVEVLIPEPTTYVIKRYFRDKYSREVLRYSRGASELHFVSSNWFDENWNIREEEVGRQIERRGSNNLAFHAFLNFEIFQKRLEFNISEPDKIEENVKALRNQIKLSGMLNPGPRQPVLVMHVWRSKHNDAEAAFESARQVLKRSLDQADESNVLVSVEIDTPSRYGHYHATNHDDIVNYLIDPVNEYARAEGLGRIGITFDFSHTFINTDGDYAKLYEVVRDHGHLIDYAHINYPSKIMRQQAKDKKMPVILKKTRLVWDSIRHSDGHRGIVGIPGEAEFDEFIRYFAGHTNVRETGLVNLEVFPRWMFLYNFWRSGTTNKNLLVSYKKLDQLINKRND